nr:histone H1.3-like [Chrysemys picta bellii]
MRNKTLSYSFSAPFFETSPISICLHFFIRTTIKTRKRGASCIYPDEHRSAAAPSQAPASKRTKRKKRKAVPITRKDREGFAHFILQTVDFSQHSGEVSLGVIRKELAAAGIDVKKNKARIKAGLGKLVATNVLLKVPGSYKLIAEAKLPHPLVKKDKSPKKQGARGTKKQRRKKPRRKQRLLWIRKRELEKLSLLYPLCSGKHLSRGSPKRHNSTDSFYRKK